MGIQRAFAGSQILFDSIRHQRSGKEKAPSWLFPFRVTRIEMAPSSIESIQRKEQKARL